MARIDLGNANIANGGGLDGEQITVQGQANTQRGFTWPTPTAWPTLAPFPSRPGTEASLEQIIRPFTRLAPKWPTPVTQGPNEIPDLPEAFLEWGSKGDFTTDSDDMPVEDLNADGYGGGRYNDVSFDPVEPGQEVPRKEPADQDKAKGVHEYNEMDRQVQRTKIWNPEDNGDWMIVERVTSIRFRGPKGQIVKFNLRPPPMQVKPDTDQLSTP